MFHREQRPNLSGSMVEVPVSMWSYLSLFVTNYTDVAYMVVFRESLSGLVSQKSKIY